MRFNQSTNRNSSNSQPAAFEVSTSNNYKYENQQPNITIPSHIHTPKHKDTSHQNSGSTLKMITILLPITIYTKVKIKKTPYTGLYLKITSRI